MAEVIPFERFEVRALPGAEGQYVVIVQRLPLAEEGPEQRRIIETEDLVGWFKVYACADCALAVHKRQVLNPAHCGVPKAAIKGLGFDPSTL